MMDQPHNTPYSAQAKDAVRRMHRLVILVSAIGYALYSLIVAPLYTQLASNVVSQNALITNILYYIIPAIDIIVFFIVYPATVYAIWRGGLVGGFRVPLTFALITLAKYVANFFMTCLTDGGLPSLSYFLESDLPVIAPTFLLELLQYALIIFCACLIIRKRKKAWQYQVLLDESAAGDERSLAFPVKKLFSYANPMQWSSFAAALIFFVGRVAMHLIYQVALLVYNGSWDGAAVLAFDLISDFILSAVAYFVMLLLLSSFDRRDVERLAASVGSSA